MTSIKTKPIYALEEYRRLRFDYVIHMHEGLKIPFRNPDNKDVKFVVSPEMADFLVLFSVCAMCGARISKDLSRCACDNSKELRVLIDHAYYQDFDIFYEQVKSRAKKAKRAELKRAYNRGATPEEKRALWDVQEGRCYYCAIELDDGDSGALFDIDHYVPISEGGDGSIANIVFACSECNNAKGVKSAEWFMAIQKTALCNRTRKIVTRIHDRRMSWLKSLEFSKKD